MVCHLQKEKQHVPGAPQFPACLQTQRMNSWKFPPRGSQAPGKLPDYTSRTSTAAHCMSQRQSHQRNTQVHDSLDLTRKHMSELKHEGKEGTWKFLYSLSVLMKFSQDINNTLNGLFLCLNVTNLTIQAFDGRLKLCFFLILEIKQKYLL